MPIEVPYSKFKPDLISWDKEHFMTSSSSNFGLMLEMLKKEDQFIVFEQLQTRLGKYRDEKDIISRVVSLLDTMNEETCFNKLSKAWETITCLSRGSNESLNDFLARFETIQ